MKDTEFEKDLQPEVKPDKKIRLVTNVTHDDYSEIQTRRLQQIKDQNAWISQSDFIEQNIIIPYLKTGIE